MESEWTYELSDQAQLIVCCTKPTVYHSSTGHHKNSKSQNIQPKRCILPEYP